jgi:hypothetical protein
MRLVVWSSRWVFGLATYAVVVYALVLIGRIEVIWHATLIACAAFHLLCYVAPGFFTKLISMPRAFLVHHNLGTKSLQWQSITYAAYHTHWYSNMTHAGFFFDGVAWYVVAWTFVGPMAFLPLLLWHAYQAATFRERGLALGLGVSWLGVAAAAWGLVAYVGVQHAYTVAQYVLVSMGIWRFIGHWVEPLPPDVAGNQAFVKLRDVKVPWRLAAPALLGSLAEFSAGLPFRLLNFWVYAQMQRVLGYHPSRQLTLREIEAETRKIHELGGWAASSYTRHLATQRPPVLPGEMP